jgi:hypothetical protein
MNVRDNRGRPLNETKLYSIIQNGIIRAQNVTYLGVEHGRLRFQLDNGTIVLREHNANISYVCITDRHSESAEGAGEKRKYKRHSKKIYKRHSKKIYKRHSRRSKRRRYKK